MEEAKLKRISELTRISRMRALTQQEQEERACLRRAYADEMKQSLHTALDQVYVLENGEKVKLTERKRP